jgi:hypothetical protein
LLHADNFDSGFQTPKMANLGANAEPIGSKGIRTMADVFDAAGNPKPVLQGPILRNSFGRTLLGQSFILEPLTNFHTEATFIRVKWTIILEFEVF